jgi:hypothetical protein
VLSLRAGRAMYGVNLASCGCLVSRVTGLTTVGAPNGCQSETKKGGALVRRQSPELGGNVLPLKQLALVARNVGAQTHMDHSNGIELEAQPE